jgi:Flp pilus assembly protein TadD
MKPPIFNLRSFLLHCSPLFLLLLATVPAKSQESTTTPQYPVAWGVYVLDSGSFVVLNHNSINVKRYRTFSSNATIVVSGKGISAATTGTSSFPILDWTSVGQDPLIYVPATVAPVKDRPDLIAIVPTKPLQPGIYSVKIYPRDQDYPFGVDTPDLLSYWISVVAKSPSSWQAHNYLGAELYMRGQIDDAYIHFQKAAALHPAAAEVHNNLGLVLSYKGKMPEAIKEFETADKLTDNASIVTNLANAYEQAKRYDDAIRTYRQALALDPNAFNASAHCNLGYALMQQGRVEDAIDEFQQAIQLDPNMPQPQEDLKEAAARENKIP